MKRDFGKFVLAAILLLVFNLSLFAVVAKPGTGLYGDEYGHYRKDADGRIYAPSRQAGGLRRQPGIESTFPTQGEVRSLVILVNYADVSFSVPNPREAFSKMLNQPGYSENGGTGSARDYFLASSSGVFRPSFDVYGPVTLPQKRAYYGSNDGDAVRMVIDACDLLENDIDWTLYDENGDGMVDNVFIYYAGYNEAEGGPDESVWPHRHYVYTEDEGKQIWYYYKGKDGKDYWLMDYACTSELRGDNGKNMCGIGTFCHEFSHVLGLDDLYDTRQSDNYTVGSWDIMCYGSYNNEGRTPPTFTAFERFMLGWMTPEQLSEKKDHILEPIETSNKAYLVAAKNHNFNASDPAPGEYWLLENRQRLGWDQPEGCLAGTGLLVSHIFWNKKRWDNNSPNNSRPFVFDICEAWNQNPEESSGSDTYPGLYQITQFIPVGVVGDSLRESSLSNIRLFDGDKIAFYYGGSIGTGLFFTPRTPPKMQTTMLHGKPLEMKADAILLDGKGIPDSVVSVFSDTTSFEISADSVSWTTSPISFPVAADSTCHIGVYVRYRASFVCSSDNGMLIAQTSNRKLFTQVPLYGESRRQTIITPVQALGADSITPYAFTARWEQQEDADEYRLAVYSVREEQQTLKFQPNMRMSQHGASYTTEYSLLPVSVLNVAIAQSFGSEKSDYRGCVLIDALTGGRIWQRVDSVSVRAVNSAIRREYTFSGEQDYHQFRLTYKTLKGNHYTTITSVSYTLSAQPVYVFSNTEETILAPSGEFIVRGLQPGTDYYYAIRAAENKGCEPHVSDWGNSVHVHTIAGSDSEKQFVLIRKDNRVTAYLPVDSEKDSFLKVFDMTGTQLLSVPLEEGGNTFTMSVEGLVHGQIYIVKYCPGGKVSRKGLWSKFIY